MHWICKVKANNNGVQYAHIESELAPSDHPQVVEVVTPGHDTTEGAWYHHRVKNLGIAIAPVVNPLA